MVPFMHRMSPSTMEENPLWLVVLCDMMTNLMLFFLVMFVFTQQGLQRQKELARVFDTGGIIERPEDRKGEQIVREFKEREAEKSLKVLLSGGVLKDSVTLDAGEDAIRVRLRENLLFKSGYADIDPKAEKTISVLAGILKQMDNEVIVEGHTDDVPPGKKLPFKSNWELSVARSYSVVERLVAEGVPPGRLVAAGYGEHHPIAPNDSVVNRAKNRRIEILIERGNLKAAREIPPSPQDLGKEAGGDEGSSP